MLSGAGRMFAGGEGIFSKGTESNTWCCAGERDNMINMTEEQQLKSGNYLRDVDRALAELRRGAPVVLRAFDGAAAVVQAADTINDASLEALTRLSGGEPSLLLTSRRASALGIEPRPEGDDDPVVAIALSGRNAERVVELADPTAWKGEPLRRRTLVDAPNELACSAIDWTTLARVFRPASSAFMRYPRSRLPNIGSLLPAPFVASPKRAFL